MLKEYETGKKVEAICPDHGVKRATFTNWKKNYCGMDGGQLKWPIELEDENRKLKGIYADLALDNKMFKDVLSKKW